MKKFEFFKYDDNAMELPVNIVVMLVVGMVALATLIAIIPTPTKEMSVFVEGAAIGGESLREGNSIIVTADNATNPFAVTVKIRVTDKDGNPVRGSNVILRGLGGATSNNTDINGVVVLTTPEDAKVSLAPNQNEGTMDLKILADGFYDYEKKDAVLIIKTR